MGNGTQPFHVSNSNWDLQISYVQIWGYPQKRYTKQTMFDLSSPVKNDNTGLGWCHCGIFLRSRGAVLKKAKMQYVEQYLLLQKSYSQGKSSLDMLDVNLSWKRHSLNRLASSVTPDIQCKKKIICIPKHIVHAYNREWLD